MAYVTNFVMIKWYRPGYIPYYYSLKIFFPVSFRDQGTASGLLCLFICHVHKWLRPNALKRFGASSSYLPTTCVCWITVSLWCSAKCSVLDIGKCIVPLTTCSLHIRNDVLNVNKIAIDLGITVTDDLEARAHINSVISKAYLANAILHCFLSVNIDMLKRACII